MVYKGVDALKTNPRPPSFSYEGAKEAYGYDVYNPHTPAYRN